MKFRLTASPQTWCWLVPEWREVGGAGYGPNPTGPLTLATGEVAPGWAGTRDSHSANHPLPTRTSLHSPFCDLSWASSFCVEPANGNPSAKFQPWNTMQNRQMGSRTLRKSHRLEDSAARHSTVAQHPAPGPLQAEPAPVQAAAWHCPIGTLHTGSTPFSLPSRVLHTQGTGQTNSTDTSSSSETDTPYCPGQGGVRGKVGRGTGNRQPV